MVGSYSSTKCDCMNWMVKADFPTPIVGPTGTTRGRRQTGVKAQGASREGRGGEKAWSVEAEGSR